MPLIHIDISEIAELGTQVAMYGALRGGDVSSDSLFDLIVSIAVLIYELAPGG